MNLKRAERQALAIGGVGLALLWCAGARAAAWRIEAEKAGDGTIQLQLAGYTFPAWKVEPSTNASEGAFLGGAVSAESHPVPTRIPHAGTYRSWVRHYQTPGKPTGFFVLFRDDLQAAMEMQPIDWRSSILTTRPYLPAPEAPKDAKPAFAWTAFDVTFERPMEATISFGAAFGKTGGKVGIDCVVLADDPAFDPQKIDLANVPLDPGPAQAQAAPTGLQPAPTFKTHSAFFVGEEAPERQFQFGLINNCSFYYDYPWLVQLGVNHDHAWCAGSKKCGVSALTQPIVGYFNLEFVRQHPPPEGRFVNADGATGSVFSLSYEPYRAAYLEDVAQGVLQFKDFENIKVFSIADEGGGYLDYSVYSRDRFHKWLVKRYGNIGALNAAWRTQYDGFDEVPLAKATNDNKAAWFAFREFCGLELVTLYAEKAQTATRADTGKRAITAQASCLHIMSPSFTSVSPIDFEDLLNVGFAGQPQFGWDAYSTEDYYSGCEVDFLLSLMNGRRLVNNEWNVHSQDARIAARTFWTMIGKGVKGVSCYMLHDNPMAWVETMWGLLNIDFTPRDKLGALADATHEVRRLERLLMPAAPAHFVKPVALYYSRMDLSLPQQIFDVYGSAVDSPYRVYSVLRGMGYPVRWITPRQIEAGGLKDVAAVALVDVKYVPQKAAALLAEWVKQGGCLIGDQWPGAFDEYGHQQGTLAEVFGVRAADEPQRNMTEQEASLAFQQASSTIYAIDPKVLAAMNPEELAKHVDEMWEQWDATHPVAQAVGRWHLSGYALKNVKCVAGEVIGMGFGTPSLVINQHGKGHALYCAAMLGTLYDAGPIHYEWDTSREGTSLGRILDAYLRYCGVAPFAEVDLPLRAAQKMRVELPLADGKGNVMLGFTSINDLPLTACPVALRWPDSAPKPKLLLACAGGSRRMQAVPFEIKGGKLRCTLPGFDTHAMLLALTASDPLLSLDFGGVPRGAGGLLEVRPAAKLKVTATIWNPAAHKLPAGEIALYAPPGWYCTSAKETSAAVPAYGSQQVAFELAAPGVCAKRNLHPIVFKYAAGKATSPPATEMIWWTR